jgi:hypothetical protein
MAGHFGDYLTDPRHLYYTLYSLEKVGDLGSLEKLGSHDWYHEGAAVILERQGKDGGWGSSVNTSFALLFLTRATRRLGISSAPTLFTGRKGPEGDLVYIEKLGGFVSARKLLRHAGERRSPQLSAVVDEAVRNYPPDREVELVPCLLALWGKPDALTSIARRELKRITGVQDSGPRPYVRWLEDLGKIGALEARDGATAEEMSLLLRSVEPVKLKCRIVGLAGKRGLRAMTGLLVEEMALPSAEYRERIHGVLSLWVADAVRPPSRRDAGDWERIAREWSAWWVRNQGSSLQ